MDLYVILPMGMRFLGEAIENEKRKVSGMKP